MKRVEIRHRRILCIVQLAAIFLNRVFTKENETSFLRKSSSPFSLQELKPLNPMKEIDKFISLMVIGMKKIMCNNEGGKFSEFKTKKCQESFNFTNSNERMPPI